MPGLLIGGLLVDVPGVNMMAPGEHPSARLSPGDCQPRKTSWVRQVTLHTTKGKWPQSFVPGDGSHARVLAVADYWRGDPQHGGCHIIVDGTHAVCLADCLKVHAYQATTVNEWAVGIEMVQYADGSILESTLTSTVSIVLALCDVLGIPLQIDSAPYANDKIIERLRHGGPDVVGVHGHRSNAWMFPEWIKDPAKRMTWPNGYADRGRGDPGDEIFARLKKAGAMVFGFDKREDLTFWRGVQRDMNRAGEKLAEDGQCGPGTVGALRRRQLWNGGVFLERPAP